MSQSYSSPYHRGGGSRGSFTSKWNDLPEPPLCLCNLRACVKTSMTNGNPGRRFFGCPMFSAGVKGSGCDYFQWIDPPTCPREEEMLLPLVKKMKNMEVKARKRKMKENCMLISMIASWVLLAATVIYCYFKCLKMNDNSTCNYEFVLE
ncbi:hypothetical protein CJ030_MR1G018337 [Morella rubra]|uniref:GRF-type domain-containing protein n=1 Tax=Morella rubra TaxID=262757 RepID=A0A6A1WN48_9ROSI|nr:hypothetical protein CJ030_MR1G018337 [Morella rubra]